MSFATGLCLIPENVLQAPVKITVNGLAAGCSHFTVKSTDIFYSVALRILCFLSDEVCSNFFFNAA